MSNVNIYTGTCINNFQIASNVDITMKYIRLKTEIFPIASNGDISMQYSRLKTKKLTMHLPNLIFC